MRVIHIIKAAGVAGAERHLLHLLPRLRAQGIDARFLFLTPRGDAARPFIEEAAAVGVPTECVPLPRSLAPRALLNLVGRLRAAQPDIVHTHLIHANVYGTLAARMAGVRCVMRSLHTDSPRFDRLPLRLMARALWAMTDAGVCISQSVQRYAVRVEGARPDKLRVIYYGLPNTPRYDRDAVRAELAAAVAGLPLDGLWLGLFSRLVEPKGIPYALQAMAHVRAEHPTAYLLIAGDGPLKDALTAQAQSLGIADRVHFLGWRTDAHRLMAALDLFLMPSLWEGFGISLLEAMSQAVPIIGSTASAIPEVIVDGQTGLTVPPADAPALAHAISRLLADAPLRRALGEAGLARLHRQFGVDRMVDEHRALYAQLAKIP